MYEGFDEIANLNQQVANLQRSFIYNTPDGKPVQFECYLTGALHDDYKLVSNENGDQCFY